MSGTGLLGPTGLERITGVIPLLSVVFMRAETSLVCKKETESLNLCKVQEKSGS